MPPYVVRSIEGVLRRAAREFPAVVLTGPRQSGKTTVLRRLFGRRCGYVSVDAPDVAAAAAADPRGFLDAHRPPVIIDEAQHAPFLLPYIKQRIDERRGAPGQFLLSGSQNLALAAGVTESLAGRAAVLRLYPLAMREQARDPTRNLPWERRARRAGGAPTRDPAHRRRGAADRPAGSPWPSFLRGNYPEVAGASGRDPHLWHASFVQTYLERDVRSLRQIGDLTSFQAFLRALAARAGQLLNLSDISRDLGVAVNTAKAWLSVLEAGCQVFILRPWFANIGKRLVKTPKVYFTDTGVLCHLVGLRDPAHAAAGPMTGAIFETAVLMEIVKTFAHRGQEPRVSFWRTADGSEVDFVADTGAGLVPIEAKATSTPRPGMADGIKRFRSLVPGPVLDGLVVHAGDIRLPLAPGVTALPLRDL